MALVTEKPTSQARSQGGRGGFAPQLSKFAPPQLDLGEGQGQGRGWVGAAKRESMWDK
jgi:hypothetical protein